MIEIIFNIIMAIFIISLFILILIHTFKVVKEENKKSEANIKQYETIIKNTELEKARAEYKLIKLKIELKGLEKELLELESNQYFYKEYVLPLKEFDIRNHIETFLKEDNDFSQTYRYCENGKFKATVEISVSNFEVDNKNDISKESLQQAPYSKVEKL